MRSTVETPETLDVFAGLDREEIIEKATTVTFERLHQLTKKGCRPDFNTSVVDAISLSTP